MWHQNLSKLTGADNVPFVRPLQLLLLASLAPAALSAQGAVSGDLWRIADGVNAVPGVLTTSPLGALWSPAVTLPRDVRVSAGIESINTPEEIGVTGTVVAVLFRSPAGTVSLAWGRMGLDDIQRTETSPEAAGGLVPAYAHLLSAGLARNLSAHTSAGLAARLLSGRLGGDEEHRLGLDVGITHSGVPRTRLAFATRFLDPLLRDDLSGTTAQAAAEVLAYGFEAGGSPASAFARYAVTVQHGESAQHLLGGSLNFSRILSLEAAAVRESVSGTSLWRSRFALGLGAARYRVEVGRDGGANDFGATWRFSLTAEFR
jgi:hypothetical protein